MVQHEFDSMHRACMSSLWAIAPRNQTFLYLLPTGRERQPFKNA